MHLDTVSRLSDAALVAELKRLARSERDTTAQLVAHLAELDARQLHLAAGFSSLFGYCCAVLRLSEHESYNRIEAARTARQFPAIIDGLADGSLNLTTVRLLASHLTPATWRELLRAAAGKSKREVEELLARHAPRPETPPSIRKLPTPRSAAPIEAAPTDSTGAPGSSPPSVPAPAPVAASVPPRRPVETAVAPNRYEIRFTAGAATRDKLRLAQDLLRHAVPSGDPAEIIDRALTVLLEDLARRKFAATERPRASRGSASGSRAVPAQVKRAVWLRDGGQCAFVSAAGRRCGERGFLEFHHVEPYGIGGEATVANIALRCRAHNAYEGDLFFGVEHERSRSRTPQPECEATRSGTSPFTLHLSTSRAPGDAG